MKIEDIKTALDSSNDKLTTIGEILVKVQTEITTVSATQAATIAALQAQLESIDVVPDDVQASLNNLNGSVDNLNALAAALDAINPSITALNFLLPTRHVRRR